MAFFKLGIFMLVSGIQDAQNFLLRVLEAEGRAGRQQQRQLIRLSHEEMFADDLRLAALGLCP